jgi:glycosyl transferase family 2
LAGGTFVAETMYGTVLAVNLPTHELVHAPADGPDRALAVVHIPRTLPFAFVLFENPGLQPFGPRGYKPRGPIIVVRRRPMPGGTFAFCDPFDLSYLMAHSEIAEDGIGMVAFSGREVDDWHHYSLAGVAQSALPLAINHQITLIEQVVATSPICILDLLRDAPVVDRPVIASLVTGTLIPTDVEVFADYLLDDRTRLDALASLFPNDPWAETGLPALWRLLQERRAQARLVPPPRQQVGPSNTPPSTITVIGPELDRLATDGYGGGYVSLAQRSIVAARRAVAPVKDICIVATARDDGLYLLDWLVYHRSIGVEQVFLYTNNNTDGSDRLLRALAAAGELSLIESTLSLGGVSPVYKALGHALSMLPEVLNYRWCAIIDSDEMIGIDKNLFPSVKDYIAWQELQPVDAIALNWLTFGSSGALRWHDEPLPCRFRDRYLDYHINTIFRPRMFHHAITHFPCTDGASAVVCRDATGQPHPLATPHSPTPRDDPAWIAHYFYRSFEEFIWKFARGRGDEPLQEALPEVNVPEEFMEAFVRQHRELPLTQDDRMLAFMEEMEAEARRLRALPGVADALDGIHAYYQRRSACLAPMLQKLREAAAPKQAAFYDLLLKPQLPV